MTPSQPRRGQLIGGRYRLVEPAGHGPAWRARDEWNNVVVVLKQVPEGDVGESEVELLDGDAAPAPWEWSVPRQPRPMARLRFAWIAGGLVLVALAATPSLLLAYAFDAVVTVFPEPSEAKPGQRQPDRIRLNPSVYCSNQGEFAARVTMNWPIPFSFFQCWGLMEKGTQNLTSIHFRNQCRTVDPLHRMPDRVMSAHTVSCTTADVDGVDLDMVVCCPPGPDAQAAVGIPAQQRPAKPPRELVKYCPEPGQYPIRMTWQRSGTYPESLCPELKKAAVEDLTSDHYQSRCRALDGAQRYKGRVSSAHVLSCMESVGGSGGDNREFAAEVVACCVSE